MTERIVPLGPSMVGELMALSTAAHWNQNEADWLGMLGHGRGWGIVAVDGHGNSVLAASTLVLPYEQRFAWISMVLVLPAFRGRGFARRLLEPALDDLSRARLLPVLDATPAGHPVYRQQGFEDRWGFARWRRPAGAWTRPAARATSSGLRPLAEADWPAIAALDAPAFGASRLPLLRDLAMRLPAAAWVIEGEGRLRGLLLGREGRTAFQLGPLVLDERVVGIGSGSGSAAAEAARRDAACALLGAAQDALAQGGRLPTLVVDLRDGQDALQGWLEGQGYAFERRFTRMVRGAAPAPGEAARVVLVGGPELG